MCNVCQRTNRIQRSPNQRSILQFRPFDILGMDYIGPIWPVCQKTRAEYILMSIDYFTRFLFAKPTLKADSDTTAEFMCNHVMPIFGWPKLLYTDNSSHFVNYLCKNIYASRGIMHFAAAISHLSSVGLAEQYVQIIMAVIRKTCISNGDVVNWGLYVQETVIIINTRLIKMHGFIPAELLLGFNLILFRLHDKSARDWLLQDAKPEEVIHPEVWQAVTHVVA